MNVTASRSDDRAVFSLRFHWNSADFPLQNAFGIQPECGKSSGRSYSTSEKAHIDIRRSSLRLEKTLQEKGAHMNLGALMSYNDYVNAMRRRSIPIRRGLGQLSQPPMAKGARFAYGYNTGYTTGPFEASEIAELTNGASLTDGAVSRLGGGTLSYFIALEGKSNRDWASGTDLKESITQLIISNGYSIDLSSIQFQFEPVQGATTPPVVYTGPPGSPGVPATQPSGPGFFDQIAAELKIQKDEAQMLVFGGAALLLILVMKR